MKRLLLIALFTLAIQVHASDKIQPINSICEIASLQLDHDTLFIFDVDKVLLTSCDQVFVDHRKQWKAVIEQAPDSDMEEVKYLASLFFLNSSFRPVEREMVELVNLILRSPAKAIALTSRLSGPLGLISSMEEFTRVQLDDLGVNFSQSFSNQEGRYPMLRSEHCGPPSFYKGILSTNRYAKGPSLIALLDDLNWRPSLVVFLDDEYENLLSVATALEERAIPFQGYHYRAIEKQFPETDTALVQFQLYYLKKNQIWLSDEKAKEMMSQRAA